VQQPDAKALRSPRDALQGAQATIHAQYRKLGIFGLRPEMGKVDYDHERRAQRALVWPTQSGRKRRSNLSGFRQIASHKTLAMTRSLGKRRARSLRMTEVVLVCTRKE
jgi:hypothetical protein